METRLGFVGIMIENRESNAERVNTLLTEYGDLIAARMGLPYSKRNCSVITLIVDTTTDRLGELTGRLGNITGVSVKSGLHKAKRL